MLDEQNKKGGRKGPLVGEEGPVTGPILFGPIMTESISFRRGRKRKGTTEGLGQGAP